MFFLIEMFMQWVRSKHDEYEKAMNKWISEGENSNHYNYRTASDYRHRFGEGPFEKTKIVLKIVGGIILSLAFVFFLSLVVNNSVEQDNKARDKAYSGHTCKAHEIGDKVKIDYGTYENATGVIVGGCDPKEDYQVKLDNQKFDMPNDGNDKPVDIGGNVISVDTYKNLIKIEKEKDESK